MCAVCATCVENQKERPGDRRAVAEPKAVRQRLEERAGQGGTRVAICANSFKFAQAK
jgi:hypothetical protein